MKQRLEWKVGLFVAVGLLLAALMVMRFSKGTSAFTSAYEVQMVAANSSGIIKGASVLMAGVPVGNVVDIQLAPNGSNVTMVASILSTYKISKSSVFGIETVGFLGDRYISIKPGAPPPGEEPEFLKDGDVVMVEAPFEFTQVAQTAAGLMKQLGGSLQQLSNAVERLDRTVLSDKSLGDLTATMANFRGLSERALVTIDSLNAFVETNTPALNGSISNFTLFTEQLNRVTMELQLTVATNRQEITAVVDDMGRAMETVNTLLSGVQNGEGLAGRLLRDDEMATYTAIVMSNMMAFSSNLNNKGLWGVIRKPKKDD